MKKSIWTILFIVVFVASVTGEEIRYLKEDGSRWIANGTFVEQIAIEVQVDGDTLYMFVHTFVNNRIGEVYHKSSEECAFGTALKELAEYRAKYNRGCAQINGTTIAIPTGQWKMGDYAEEYFVLNVYSFSNERRDLGGELKHFFDF